MPKTAVSFEDVQSAHEVVAKFAHRTPIWTCETLDRISGMQLFFKCENFQKSGAFKFRGAITAVSRLSDAEKQNGVVTHSSGNHAAALTRAAAINGVEAHIVMPENSSKIKIAAVEEYGGRVTLCKPTLESRESTAELVRQKTGATLIPPFNHPDVIAGQGTCAKELFEDVESLDAIVVPIGGGGLMSGSCLAAAAMSPSTRIIGAEPAGADDAYQSLAAGRMIPLERANTIADGLRTSLGDMTWPIIQKHVEQIALVSDEEIVEVMKTFFERSKLLIETSCCVAVGAALLRKIENLSQGSRVGVIITGGNVDLAALPF
ncbi:pyridoxal-phosphate dependent enzyme [Mariniblastus fucicola]|uniref:L-threonine dehydratase catabolic TdcB n=1 Tax=Mariniblastus fucicola TaxID=980251 RepID=A0A5B9P551_9BACT|nr:pyridoxal-phosphate dependent enzyme [Mariniblastus fucicola]QEG21727.1 L-threonine dehydratase catabolic TdcB [Mariniblastus fucicola]